MDRKNKSPVWKLFFKDAVHKRIICTLCGEEFKYRYTTTNLRFHLKRYHPEWLPGYGMNWTASEHQVVPYANSETRSINAGVNESLDVSTAKIHPTWKLGSVIKTEDAGYKRATITSLTANLSTVNVKAKQIDKSICLNFQNLSIVEDSGFRKLMEEHIPHYLLRSRISEIQEIRNDHSKYIRKILNKCKYVSISTVLWTNLNMEAFITFTVHCFSNDKFTSHVLNASRIRNDHSSEYLASVMHRIFNHFYIFEKITAIVACDDDDALKAACSMLNITYLPCIFQLLNAIMTEVLTQNDDAQVLLQRCKNLFAHFKMNPTSDVLRDEYIEPPLWYSALHMFQRLVKVKEPLSTTLVALPEGPEPLASNDWLNLDDFITVLKQFELMTSELSLDVYCSISKVEPLIRSVKSILQNVTCTTDLGAALKKSLLEKLDDRLSTYTKYIIPSVATFLDPRFKRIGLGLEATMESTFSFVVEQLSELKNTTNSAGNENLREHENSNFSKAWNFYIKKVSELSSKKAPSNSAEMSVKRYLDQPYLKLHECPFKFWIMQSCMEPELADIAIKFMCIPATCIPADRFYSEVGINEKREIALQCKTLKLLYF